MRNHREKTHCDCGAELHGDHEPIYVSGWYGDYKFQWTSGVCHCVGAQCARCRYRADWAPETFPGLSEYLPAATIHAARLDFSTVADAWEYLRGLALVEMSDAGVRA